MSLKYRPEIDGLRAVAVLPVILFHAGLSGFSGGFVGVDVFFVISGFLITSIIVRELEAGTFSIIKFYERRARRILPALILMLIATILAGAFILLPYELKNLGEAVVSVMFFVSNILFWQQTSYFAPQSELNPLLHTWSLAVEEQFYVLYPPLMILLWKIRKDAVWILLGLGCLVSFGLAQYLSTRTVMANFYLLPTRAWELMVGALIAIWLSRRSAPTGLPADILAFSGLVAITLSIVLFSKATPFPSYWALLPVLGTGAIILGASQSSLIGRALSWKPLVGVGLISYSAYLWHQPVFAYARLLDDNTHTPIWLMMVLALLSLGAAWVSWKYVEAPFRNKTAFSQGAIFSLSGLGTLACAAIGAVFIFSSGLPQRYDERQVPWIATGPLEYGDYVRTAYRETLGHPLDEAGANLVLIGDSFSQDFYNVIQEQGGFSDYNISSIYLPASCQVHYGLTVDEALKNVPPEHKRTCAKRRLTDKHVEKIRRADIVIIASRWREWAARQLPATIDAMALEPSQTLLVVGPKYFEQRRRNLLAFDPGKPEEAIAKTPADVLSIDAFLSDAFTDGQYVNIIGSICDDGCPLLTPSGQLISYDGIHLTPDGAKFVGDILFTSEPLADYASAQTSTTREGPVE